MPYFKKMGDVTRTAWCPVCDRQYRGTQRLAIKLLRMHCRTAHNLELDENNEKYIQTVMPYPQKDHTRDDTRGVRVLRGSEHLDELRSKRK